ncbi:MAG: hypothetical protein LBM75_05550 [Myxococcales bacterium]|jgi:shikimate dehydrogenase|nr:hypothetical protein [Myxococcales bacterium]
MPQFFALLGNAPLTSASPLLQNAAFTASGIDARYFTIAEADPIRAFDLARRLGLSGLNVTSPFKEELARFVELQGSVRQIGAINTVRFDGARALGFNTDPIGVLGALREFGVTSFTDEHAVVLGTGGAARAALFALTRRGAHITLLGRDVRKAQALARDFGASGFAGFEGAEARRSIERAALIVGALSTRERVIDPEWIASTAVVLDANYGASSRLLLDARQRGCRTIDGHAWLLHQGAAAFELWTGARAPIEAMRAGLAAVDSSRRRSRRGIALTGFSGAGKSALCRELARHLSLPAIDLDLEIERRTGRSIPELFRTSGEAGFRELERDVLASISPEPSILALGGGALLDPSHWPIVHEERLVLHLAIDLDTAIARVTPGSRPLFEQGDLHQLFDARRAGYLATCDVVLDARHSIEDLAAHIVRLWSALAR